MRNFFLRFRQGYIEEFWRPLWKWLLELSWPLPPEGFSLDLDSTVFQRSGNQEGAKRGYNPSRPGRHSHHPLIAFLAEAPLVLHAWLRSGNTGSARGAVAFLTEAFALMPANWKLRTIRADSGFFENSLLSFLEAKGIPYIVVARLTQNVKRKAAALAHWTAIDENYAWARFSLQLQGWSAPREFFFIFERISESKSAVELYSPPWMAYSLQGIWILIQNICLKAVAHPCFYAAPNATSEAGKQVLLPRMVDRGKNGGASTPEALVRLAVVEQIYDAVYRVLEKRCRSKDDDTDGWIDKRNAIERSDQSCEFPHIAEIFE